MSLFDEDLVERELGYDPDPDKNMRLQIEKKFKMTCDMYSPTQPCSVLVFLRDQMLEFMAFLRQNVWRNENNPNPVLPEWWQGDFLYIIGFGATIIQLTDGRAGVQVSWKYTNSLEYQSIDLYIDVTGFMEKYKVWCI